MLQSIRSPVLIRPTVLSARLPVAGPSSRRSYANTVESPSSPSIDRQPIEDANDAALEQDAMQSRSLLNSTLPPNISFEGFEAGEGIAPKKDLGGCESRISHAGRARADASSQTASQGRSSRSVRNANIVSRVVDADTSSTLCKSTSPTI